jgi:hypothetical protein
MKRQFFSVIFFPVFLFALSGFSQSSKVLTGEIDSTSFITCGRISAGESDTVVFQDNVTFHSRLVNIDSVDRIVYNKLTKKLIVRSVSKGTVTLGKGMKLVTMLPLNNPDDWKKVTSIEYTIGEQSAYVK